MTCNIITYYAYLCINTIFCLYILRNIVEEYCASLLFALRFCKVGCQPGRSPPKGKMGSEICYCGDRLLQQWVKAKACGKNIEGFLWWLMVFRFRIPSTFVMDNMKQFDYKSFRKWCSDRIVHNFYSSPKLLQANGQVEATNKVIFKLIKKK